MAIGEHIGMWCHNFAPGEQPGRGLAFDGHNGGFASFLTSLFLKTYAQYFLFLPFDLACFFSGDRGEQTLDAIQRSVKIISAESFLVCPLVTCIAQLAHQTALSMSQHFVEDVVPLVPHDEQ